MTRAFIVLKSANTDTISIAAWYSAQGVELDLHFLKALEKCYRAIEKDPLRYPPGRASFRYAFMKDFPYRVVYEVDEDIIRIYQVRHTSRKPSSRFGP
ncbi:MAG: type II toxin-antitoxin system RelE/ParE family toxin [Flavobacteriales bacterium]|nr:type II toxin-antitoxin system RelE/ParE family toxin [Flavobacteriales bacterium]